MSTKNILVSKIGMELVSLKKRPLLLFFFIILVVVLWFAHPMLILRIEDVVINAKLYVEPNKHVNKFSTDVIRFEKFKEICYRDQGPNGLANLKKYVQKLNNRNAMCKRNYHLFRSVYKIYYRYAEIVISETFMTKLEKWFQGQKDLIKATRNQSLIYILNLYSFEGVVINIVRESRPIGSVVEGGTMKYIDGVVNESAKTCPFCSYLNETATDSLGRLESEYTVITASTFKADIYHSIAILKTHNPLFFTQVQFLDCMDLIMTWFHTAHQAIPSHLYRVMYWDFLPKAGAKQIHPIIHVTLGDHHYHSRWNQMHSAGMEFSQQHGGLNYWTSLLQIHTLLGLSFSYGKASLMTYLNPIKDSEIMVISEKPCLDFFRLVYYTIRAYIDDLKLYALSMSIVFPKLGTNFDHGDELPMIFRVVSRGSADSFRSDIGAFGFYGTVNVNRDPYKLIKLFKESIMKRKDEPFTWKWDR